LTALTAFGDAMTDNWYSTGENMVEGRIVTDEHGIFIIQLGLDPKTKQWGTYLSTSGLRNQEDALNVAVKLQTAIDLVFGGAKHSQETYRVIDRETFSRLTESFMIAAVGTRDKDDKIVYTPLDGLKAQGCIANALAVYLNCQVIQKEGL
jgi:hypothetical protein